MTQTRTIRKTFKSQPTIEGAGVHLRRAFGFDEVPLFDPFLMLDDFRGDKPEQYAKGFPWHPHRGIETITYMLHGDVEHGDSLGNKGVIHPGDVQWMTAGSGIIHQEMPRGDVQGRMGGFQLWANLPARQKMIDPRYRDVKAAQIPVIGLKNGIQVRVISGEVEGASGPVQDIVIDPQYLDVSIPPDTQFVHSIKRGHTAFAYVFEGNGRFEDRQEKHFESGHLILFSDGDRVVVTTRDEPVRFLLISGKPIGEPVAWRGPIVMNTQAELKTAFEEYRDGTFIKT
ncbi:MAG: pirin family protein [Desulfobacterales bacterium]|jgi:redox-sensitive bicupin YhaK (pirin superfamily)|nr:pirin family protein [Desulfobacterales bacterium]